MPTILEMLSRSARDLPDKEALVDRGLRVSYRELDERSSSIAGFLRSRGIGNGMRVGIYSSKCAAEVYVIFALAKAGCVMVHMNPSFRDDKLHHVIEETEPSALFFHPSKGAAVERARQRGLLPPLLICLGRNLGGAGPAGALELDSILRRDRGTGWPPAPDLTDDREPAAILYTSGTTASSKGIIVTHRILAEATRVSAEVLENVAGDRLISVTPFSFDGALSQLFTATLVGATLVLQGSHFPKDVVETMLAERITGFHAVPSFWRMLLHRFPSFPEYELPHLRYLTLIGEVFPEDELARLRQILRGTGFYMMYGTTEAFRSTCLLPDELDRKPRSVGRSLPGVTIAVVDEAGAPCPAGTVGEIVHRGAFVSPGYWKRDGGRTFRPDGVHTGDLGRLDDDGYLYFVGRKDGMIKRLGYQVYPEEIEACLETIDGVAMAAVLCAPDRGEGPRIHAFVVPAPGTGLSSQAVAGHCKRHLPHYMVPDELTLRDSMPTTASGKLDRAGLLAVGEGA